MEAARVVYTDLVAVASVLVAGALIDIDTLILEPSEAHLAAALLRQQWIVADRLSELGLLHALIMTLCVYTDHSLAACGLVQALINVWRGREGDLMLKK